MILYRIRNKQTGKFFVANSKYTWIAYAGQWATDGVFFKTIDTVKNHIENLSYDWECDNAKWRAFETKHGHIPWSRSWSDYQMKISHHPERLSLFEVIVNDVTINGEKIIQATDLLNKGIKHGAVVVTAEGGG